MGVFIILWNGGEHSALCTRTERLNQSQDQAGFQSDETPAHLFQSGSPCGDSGVFPYPRHHW